MDDELYQAFITESEESITQLNNSLLSLESNPEDTEAIDDIFRRAHTLKGNFGAMGFDSAATVAHAIEDLLDEVRQGRLEVTPERMDLVFEGVDRIVDILHEIEEEGESTIDPTDIVEDLRAAAEGDGGDAAHEPDGDEFAAEDATESEGDAAESEDAAGEGDTASEGNAGEGDTASEGNAGEGDTASEGSAGEDDSADAVDAADDEEDGSLDPARREELIETALETVDGGDLSAFESLYHVEITLSGGELKGVDAGIFLESIPEEVTVAGAVPSLDAIGEGEYDDGFELFVTGLDATETAETFADGWSVDECAVTDVSSAVTRAGGSLEDRETELDDASSSTDESDDGDAASGNDGGSTPSISEVKSVRVDVDQLDELHELVEQLVTSRIKLRQAVGDAELTGMDTLDELDKISSNLQNTVMDMRLIPLKKVFDKFPRLVRDLAREQDKRVDFRVEGQDIELDRTILDEISDPLMHVLRNSVDHGIEPPEERKAAGKPETGVVELSARREHDTVVIEVSDDGGGLDVERIREKAVSKGIITSEEVAAMPDSEVFEFVFHPGFSTNDEITDVSGRGVGMDVVKTTVEALDGSVGVDSTPGEGTTFKIRLPVSVAIIKVLFVTIEDREFGVPIKYIDEIARLDRVETINGAEVVLHDDSVFPLIRLRHALDIDRPRPEEGMVVRIRPEDRQVALRCDGVTRQEEVVVTPLQGPLSGAQGLSGTAVIGDGNVIPILDVNTLDIPDAGMAAMRQAERQAAAEADSERADPEEAAD